MNPTQFLGFVKRNWRVIAILLVAVIAAVIILSIIQFAGANNPFGWCDNL